MTNILVECPDLIASVSVGVLNCLKPFEENGECRVRFIRTLCIKSCDIRWCDVLITVRGCEYITLKIVQTAKKYKRFVVYYLDDDLLNVPICDSCPEEYYSQVIAKNMTNVMEQCDMLWGVNELIREKYIAYIPSRRWLTNKVPMEVKTDKYGDVDDKIHVLYAGSTSHTELVQQVLSPVVRDIAEEYAEAVDFTFVGAASGISDVKNVLNHGIFEDYNEYRSFVENGGFSLGLAVVKTDEFYQCKYYNKFLEYTSIGCVGIYTDSKPYTYVIENGKNGFLCDNSYSGWYNAITNAIKDRRLCKDMYSKARQYVLSEHNYNAVTERLHYDFPEATSFKAIQIRTLKFIMLPLRLQFVLSRFREFYIGYGFFKGNIVIFQKICKKINRKLKGKRNV